MKHKKRRLVVLILIVAASIALSFERGNDSPPTTNPQQTVQQAPADAPLAVSVLDSLEVKGRAPKTGYTRGQFMSDWGEIAGCDLRNLILKRDLTEVIVDPLDNCSVISGKLNDPYTAELIDFRRGSTTSAQVQIDHVVALSDAWQKGAQGLDELERNQFANDPLNLLAVDGPANQNKGDGDAATWLPPNKDYRCRYVARQVAVKAKYTLWVTLAEKEAIARQLQNCPAQVLPLENFEP